MEINEALEERSRPVIQARVATPKAVRYLIPSESSVWFSVLWNRTDFLGHNKVTSKKENSKPHWHIFITVRNSFYFTHFRTWQFNSFRVVDSIHIIKSVLLIFFRLKIDDIANLPIENGVSRFQIYFFIQTHLISVFTSQNVFRLLTWIPLYFNAIKLPISYTVKIPKIEIAFIK